MLLFIFDCVNTIIFVILAKIFMELFLRPKQISLVNRMIIMCSWMLVEIVIVNLLQDLFLPKALITICCTMGTAFLLFHGGGIKIIILSAIHYGSYISVETLVYVLAIRWTSYVGIYDVKENLINVYGGVISAMLFLLVLLLIKFFMKKEDPAELTGLDIAKFLVFPIASISLIIAFAFFSRGREISEQEMHFITFIAIVFLVTNVYMYWLLRTDVNNKILKEKNMMFESHARELSDLYGQIREEHKTIAGIVHDYKNHITVITSLAISDKYEELKQYLQNLKESEPTVDVVDTGNAICSALFNAKYAEAIRKGIQIRFDISNLEGISIKDEDLVVILSNLFNNAIEACERCFDERIIDIKIKYNENMLMIMFSNTYYSEKEIPVPLSQGNAPSILRGHGLKNISHIVDSYDGHMDIVKNEKYTVRILIPCFDSQE